MIYRKVKILITLKSFEDHFGDAEFVGVEIVTP